MKRHTLGLALERADASIAILRSDGRLPVRRGPVSIAYRTRTGALLRVNGHTIGAFDREHETIHLADLPAGTLTLEVERRSLPSTGLPPGDGLRWRRMLARAAQLPERRLIVEETAPDAALTPAADSDDEDVACAGHAHLDVAWLWTYAEAARKAQRTFATAVRQLELDSRFVFTQSQPQLFAFVAERDPELFARVRAFAAVGRFDASGAAMWVEPDCNVPSGESLLAQLRLGIRWCEREIGVTPSVAWLPDTFGFANTLPTLLAHAGITRFATTKLGWNDTTVFPHARFRWTGPDGSTVLAAQIASIEGGFDAVRVSRAKARNDLLLVGHGDGGGGATDGAVADASRHGRWMSLASWFEGFGDTEALPEVRDELYLEEHRGVLTTHHDVKARNASLERALGEAETALAWARALHASPLFLTEGRAQLDRAWEILCRAQFHDVLPGTCIPGVFRDAAREYDEAGALVATCAHNARSALPIGVLPPPPKPCMPRAERDGTFTIENDTLVARLARDGTLLDVRMHGGPNLVRRAHRLALYRDRPKRWDAWNVDRDYRKHPIKLRATGHAIVEGALEVRYAFGDSLAVARISLAPNEPFVRVELAVRWRERHALLRVENELAFTASSARFGTPHGFVERTPEPRSPAERAKYEAPGQRFARIDGDGMGLAMLSLDTYGWSLERGRRATEFGHSLLRGPTWPDPGADLGDHALSYAFMPLRAFGMGELEGEWRRFAHLDGVPMFTSEDPALAIVATYLAADGDTIVVRVRECDGFAREGRIRCGARTRSVTCVDALERPCAGEAALEDGEIRARFAPFELRTFAVRVP